MPSVPLTGIPALIAAVLGLGCVFVVLSQASRSRVVRTIVLALALGAVAAGGALGMREEHTASVLGGRLFLVGVSSAVLAVGYLLHQLTAAERALIGAFSDSGRFERESELLAARNAVLQTQLEQSQAQLAQTAISGSAAILDPSDDGTDVRVLEDRAEDAEQAARRSSAIGDEIVDAVVTLERKSMRVVRHNAALCRLLGRSRGELQGARLVDVLGTNESVVRAFDIDQMAHAGSSVVVAITRPDGAQIEAELRIGTAGDGQDRQLIAVLRDVTESSEQARKLCAVEEQVRVLEAEAAAHQCAATTPAAAPADARDAATSESGPTQSDSSSQRVHASIDALIDREFAWVSETLPSDADVAHERSVEAIAHDLRVPLTSIRSFAEILLEHDDVEADERVEFLQIIQKESRRLTRMVNDLLDVRRIKSGVGELDLEDMDLRDLVRDGLNSLNGLALSRGVSFEGTWDGEVRTVRGDRDRLHRVVANLLSNAVKFSPEGGAVEVILREGEEAGSVRLGVRDHGPGIAEEDQGVVFERFSRGADGPENVSGTGLGLSICREIVEIHGARIWPESRPQSGATLWVEFPPPERVNATPAHAVTADCA